MYWFYSDNYFGLGLWLLSMGFLGAGGWLFATHGFDLEPHERLIAGFSVGLIAYLWLLNWIGRILPPFWAFMGGALVILFFGILSAFPFKRPWLDFRDWNVLPWLLAGVALWWIFMRISKGIGLFDEYKNLALISTLANGQIPALATFGQQQLLRYHYGFHLFGAGMMQLGHFMPWSAFDFSKAVLWSGSLLLAALVGRRYLSGKYSPVLLGGAMALAAGTRYLLLLLPSGFLAILDRHISLGNTASSLSAPLSQSLSAVLPMEASPKIGYPFAFLDGINPSYVMAHGGEGTIIPFLFMLALLLIGRSTRRLAVVLYAILFSFWGLASETSFVLFGIGWGGMALVKFIRQRKAFLQDPAFLFPTLGLLLSIPLILAQGGTITAMAQQWLSGPPAGAIPTDQPKAGFLGFALRWPPAVLSGQLGVMNIADPLALFVAILEMGPIVLLLPWLTQIWWRNDRGNWLLQLFVCIAWAGLLIPLVLRWESEQDITHLFDFALDTAVLLLVFLLSSPRPLLPPDVQQRFSLAAVFCLVLMCIPGVVLAGVELTASQDTVLSEHYGDAEALIVKQLWGKLPRDSKMLGPIGTPSILTGQLTGGIYSFPTGSERPIWETLLVSPRLSVLLDHGFEFVFVDSRWWNNLDPVSQRQLEDPCISVLAEAREEGGIKFVEILDLRGCR